MYCLLLLSCRRRRRRHRRRRHVQVLYVPSAQKLIEGGLFHKGDDGLFETPEVAKALLRSMVTNHGKDLEKLTGSSGEALLKVCTTYYLTILFILIIYYHHH